MKMVKSPSFFVYLCAAGVASVSAGAATVTPELSLGMSTATMGESKLGGLEPQLKWTAKGSSGDVDLEGGVTMTVQDTDKMPYSFWGKAKKSVGDSGWTVSGKVDAKSSDLAAWGLDLQATNKATTLQVQGKVKVDLAAEAATDKATIKVGNVKVTQKFSDGIGGSKWTVSPRFNVQSKKADLSVSCAHKVTVVTVDASEKAQKVTVSQTIAGNNIVTPSVTNAGVVEVEYRRILPSGGTIAATVRPNMDTGAVALEWQEGPWSATATAPLSQLSDVQVNIRRKVDAF